MFKRPSFYFYALGGWLILTNLGHTLGGVKSFIDQSAVPAAPLYPIMAEMIADERGGYFDYTFFDLFMLGMLAITLWLLLAALNAFWMARKARGEALDQMAGLNLGFWGAALIATIVFHPVDNMVVIALGAFLLSGLGFWRVKSAQKARGD